MIGKNNPFNLRKSSSRWYGSCGSTKGFVDFLATEYCVRAVAKMIMQTYRKMNIKTIAQVIERYAPPKENNTSKYIDFICAKMQCFPWDIPFESDIPTFLHWISVYEGNPISIKYIADIIDKYHFIVFVPKVKK